VFLVSASVGITAAVGSLLLISLAVQAVLTPLLVHDFHRAPVVAPFANLLLSPILGVVIPAAFVDLLVPLPGMDHALGALVAFTNSLVRMIATAAPDPRIPDVPPVLLILATLCAVAAILLWEPRAKGHSARERREQLLIGTDDTPRSRRWRNAVMVGSAAMVLALIVLHPFRAQIADGNLEISMLDVGQGDATLVVAPGGETMLIDTGGLGGYSTASRLDTGEDIIAPYLWRRGIRRIDVLVLSHMDYDHAGGAPAILRIFQPRELWMAEIPEDHALWPPVRSALQGAGTQLHLRSRGDAGSFGAVQWRVLHPGQMVLAAQHEARHKNDSSLVLHLRYGRTGMVFAGDVHRSGEFEMLGSAEASRADVLKVAHHGSRTSSSEAFLEAVAPSVALVSAGYLNPYRHPSPDVVDRLRERGTALFRTDRDGAIFLRSNGSRWWHHQP
jgi:competence protein ComEC